MEHVATEKQEEIEGKSEEEDDEIDVIGIKTEEKFKIQELFGSNNDVLLKNECIQESVELAEQNSEMQEQISSEITQNRKLEYTNEQDIVKNEEPKTKESHLGLEMAQSDVVDMCKEDKEKSTNVNNNDDDNELYCCSATTSASSSRKSSRRNSLNDSEAVRSVTDDFDIKVSMFDELGTHISDDDDDTQQIDPYQRFFFESDYLALKDNRHYHLLLQTLVALEGQRVQAIKDLDTLCVEEAKALDDPIGFVEKLQNNEPLGLPSAQNVIKLPKIPWESYASSFGPVDISLPIHHHTRSATSSNSDKGTQEAQPTMNLFNSEVADINSSETIFSEAVKNIPGKPTFNQQWTVAEQTRLEKLLQIFPQEDIEAKRWEKIAKALGNRTPKQVASRVQKYFIKLAKAGLPIPGRVPNIPRSGARTAKRATHYQMMGFRNSTFFPSYQPRVYMNDNKDDDDESSVAFSDDTSYLSDDESIPDELKQSCEYMELLELKKIKRQKIKHGDQLSLSHVGFMCDGCGTDPIVGTRWHCQDCPQETSLDFCSSCIDRGIPESRGHNRQHRFEPITKAVSFFVDGDYVGNTGSTETGYNYLDPNFLPAAS